MLSGFCLAGRLGKHAVYDSIGVDRCWRYRPTFTYFARLHEKNREALLDFSGADDSAGNIDFDS